MVLKKSYSRYFIILQEDEKGYSLSSDKAASGYAKLEVKNDKCKISYYVQNLKKEMAPYYMMLICNKKDVKKVIKIGEMNIDDYGRADVCYEYPVDNVAGSFISIDKISGAAVVKLLENNIMSIMSGFASTDIPEWKSFMITEDTTRSVKEEIKAEDQKSIFDKYEENIEIVKLSEDREAVIKETEPIRQNENKEVENAMVEDEEVQHECSKSNQEEELTHEDERIDKSENEGTSLENKDVKVENIEEKNCEDLNNELFREKPTEENNNYQREAAKDFFGDLVEGFEEIKSISTDIKRVRWYKIPVNQLEDMYDRSNYNKYTILYYPMISYQSYFRNYEHYLIGYKYDKSGKIKYLVYGIPGYKDRRYQPYEGKTGFVTWIPANYRNDEEFGYWLMFYDFRTSTIVVPVKK